MKYVKRLQKWPKVEKKIQYIWTENNICCYKVGMKLFLSNVENKLISVHFKICHFSMPCPFRIYVIMALQSFLFFVAPNIALWLLSHCVTCFAIHWHQTCQVGSLSAFFCFSCLLMCSINVKFFKCHLLELFSWELSHLYMLSIVFSMRNHISRLP